jgi:D-amino-acid oxidase
MTHLVRRRQILAGAGAALFAGALGGCGTGVLRSSQPELKLARLRASVERITTITVCTRPFREQGPRIEAERMGEQTIVHNYGHGGSGWSLSWGSSSIAVDKAMATGERDIGVIGCGALGLTSALLLQRAGARVVIYAKDLPPNVRSSLASGVWTPDSRICLDKYATPAFKQQWEDMTRKSFATYQTLLGLPGNPVEFIDNYFVTEPGPARQSEAEDTRPQFAHLQRALTSDLFPAPVDYEPGQHPFSNHDVRRNSFMMFNLVAYQRLLVNDFLTNGGKIEVREFRSPADFARLPQKTLINATGYGARALLNDESVIPVRGQLARMIPQHDVRYGIFYNHVSFIPRRDGMVFQVVGDSDYYGYGDDTTVADRKEAELAVNTIAGLFAPA